MQLENKTVQQISLKEVFEGRRFQIPDYQRGYSWEMQQRKDLIDDILETFEHKDEEHYKHYMGTIVAFPNSTSDNLEVIDGQQRLTSLTILMAAIYHTSTTLDETCKSDLRNNYLFEGSAANPLFRFISGQQRESFQSIIESGIFSITSDKLLKQDQNVKDAFEFFKRAVEKWDTKNETKGILDVIENKLGFILFVPKHEAVVGRMFEVINNRGKSLSELEKLKNYFIFLLNKTKTRL